MGNSPSDADSVVDCNSEINNDYNNYYLHPKKEHENKTTNKNKSVISNKQFSADSNEVSTKAYIAYIKEKGCVPENPTHLLNFSKIHDPPFVGITYIIARNICNNPPIMLSKQNEMKQHEYDNPPEAKQASQLKQLKIKPKSKEKVNSDDNKEANIADKGAVDSDLGNIIISNKQPTTKNNRSVTKREGWLDKQSRHVKKWRRRWVVLEKYNLYTFKNKTDSKSEATEVIDIHTALYIKPLSDIEPKQNSKNQPYCFEIYCNEDASFIFNASTENEMYLWINDIETKLNETYYLNKYDKEEKCNPKKYGKHEFNAKDICLKCGICKTKSITGIIQCHLDIVPKHMGALKPAHDGIIVKYHPHPHPIPKHSGHLSIKYHSSDSFKWEHFGKYISYHSEKRIYIHSTETYPGHGGKLINYHPYSYELYHRQPLEYFHPSNRISYHPNVKEWHHPKGIELYHPQFNKKYHTGSKQIYHPESLINYHPNNHISYHPQTKKSYHPEGLEWYHPNGSIWYHDGSKQWYHPKSRSNYHSGYRESYHSGSRKKHHPGRLYGYHTSDEYVRREWTSYNYLYIPIKIEWNHKKEYGDWKRKCCGAIQGSHEDVYRGCESKWSCCEEENENATGCEYYWSCCDAESYGATGCKEKWSCCGKTSYYATGCESKYKCCNELSSGCESRWSCCYENDAGCRKKYICCDENDSGCERRYECCGYSASSNGCETEWKCCGYAGSHSGCKKKWSCCGKINYNDKGCKTKYKCCNELSNGCRCRWTCCYENENNSGCRYECCGECLDDDGCDRRYICCKYNTDSNGCKEKWKCCGYGASNSGCLKKWICCNKDSEGTGCEQRWECCKKPSSDKIGCTKRYKCCKREYGTFFNNGCSQKWSCCNGKPEAIPCDMKCSNCNNVISVTGCIKVWKCCDNDMSHPGCKWKWSCCNKANKNSTGCQKQFKCCNAIFPDPTNRNGCRRKFDCCKKDQDEPPCKLQFACCSVYVINVIDHAGCRSKWNCCDTDTKPSFRESLFGESKLEGCKLKYLCCDEFEYNAGSGCKDLCDKCLKPALAAGCSVVLSQWICKTCKYNNSNIENICIICHTSNGHKLQQWMCIFCKFKNNYLAKYCIVCNTHASKPESNYDELKLWDEKTDENLRIDTNVFSNDLLTWICPSCTFPNDKISKLCKICNSPKCRIYSQISTKLNVLNNIMINYWTCEACKFTNNIAVRFCIKCFKFNGQINKKNKCKHELCICPKSIGQKLKRLHLLTDIKRGLSLLHCIGVIDILNYFLEQKKLKNKRKKSNENWITYINNLSINDLLSYLDIIALTVETGYCINVRCKCVKNKNNIFDILKISTNDNNECKITHTDVTCKACYQRGDDENGVKSRSIPWTWKSKLHLLNTLHAYCLTYVKPQKNIKSNKHNPLSKNELIAQLTALNKNNKNIDYKELNNDIIKYEQCLKNVSKLTHDDYRFNKTSIENYNEGLIYKWAVFYKQLNQKQKMDHYHELLAVLSQAIYISSGKKYYPRYTQIVPILIAINYELKYHDSKDKKGILFEVAADDGKSLIVLLMATIQHMLFDELVDITTSKILFVKRESYDTTKYFQILNINVNEHAQYGAPYINKCKQDSKASVIYSTAHNYKCDILDKLSLSSDYEDCKDNRLFDVNIVDEVDNSFIDLALQLTQYTLSIPGFKHINTIFFVICTRMKTISSNKFKQNNLSKMEANRYEKQIKNNVKESIMKYINDFPLFTNNIIKEGLDTWIDACWMALFCYQEGRDYIVENNKICPVDYNNTGCIQHNINWSHIIHEFLQTKHNLKMSCIGLETNMMT
eukprot:160137_1